MICYTSSSYHPIHQHLINVSRCFRLVLFIVFVLSSLEMWFPQTASRATSPRAVAPARPLSRGGTERQDAARRGTDSHGVRTGDLGATPSARPENTALSATVWPSRASLPQVTDALTPVPGSRSHAGARGDPAQCVCHNCVTV